MKYTKWCLTWILALLPIFFHIIKSFHKGHLDWNEIFATGEFFLVSIVMVAEPLGDVMISRKEASSSKLGYLLCTLLILFMATYMYSLMDSDKIATTCTNPNTLKIEKVELPQPNSNTTTLSLITFMASFVVGLLAVKQFKED